MPLRVIKLGGSLLDWPELPVRFTHWLSEQTPMTSILIVGGGVVADWIRDADRIHAVGQEHSHWLCIRALQLQSELVARLLNAPLVTTPSESAGPLQILDPWAWLTVWESDPTRERLPHTWAVTTDSIAAFVAIQINADELVLLKSCAVDEPEGIVDEYFGTLARRVETVRFVNLRDG
jgi:aspartokinase-like uncharacterized kinase